MRVHMHASVMHTRTWPAQSLGSVTKEQLAALLRALIGQPPSCEQDRLLEDPAQPLDLRRTATQAGISAQLWTTGTHAPMRHMPTLGLRGGKSGKAPPPLKLTS